MIHVRNVSKSFDGRNVLHDVTFSLRPGEFVGLVGPSGGGKSVLLKLLGDVIEPDSGSVDFDTESDSVRAANINTAGAPAGGLPGRPDRESKPKDGQQITTGFLFQEGALFDSMTVLENVAFPLIAKRTDPTYAKVGRDEAFARAHKILAAVGLSKAWSKVPGQLSGGMRRRVAIARALVSEPELVLLDDPTGGLDPVAASVIISLIKALHNEYKPTVIFVSHDIRRLLPNVERVLGLFGGTIVCDLPPDQLVAKAGPDVLKFLATRFDFDGFKSAGPNAEVRHGE